MVTLDKPFHTSDLAKLRNGIELEDGMAQVDYVEFVKENDKYTLGVEIHIGKNRIVRRMFEALGYEVSKLDRSSFAGLTKKGLNRGQYKMLDSKDLSFLKML
jgi:23S rRNA pseudouridine2605 synthase